MKPSPLQFVPVTDAPDADALALVDDRGVVGTVEAARRLNVAKSTLYSLMDSGALAFVQDGPGCRRAVPVKAIEVYLVRRLKH